MQSLVKDAIENINIGYEYNKPKIAVVGVGGAGNNSITRLNKLGVNNISTIAVNTDNLHLSITNADKKILIGKPIARGLGVGGFPAAGEQAAELANEALTDALAGFDLIFLLAGMGGGTGTGASPVIAQIAKRECAIVVSIVSTPFAVERKRNQTALEGINKLQKAADSVIVLDNNRLLKMVPNLPLDEAFSVMDHLVATVVKGITETITQPSLINLDYADVKTIMSNGGLSLMLYGESEHDPEEAVKKAMGNPLLDVNYTNISGALIHITGGPSLSLKDAHRIAECVTDKLGPNVNVIWGARVNDNCSDTIRVMSILTGVLAEDNPLAVGMLR